MKGEILTSLFFGIWNFLIEKRKVGRFIRVFEEVGFGEEWSVCCVYFVGRILGWLVVCCG
jgi:hypothetical protein